MPHNLFDKHSNPLHLHRGINIQYVVQFFYSPPVDITGMPSFRFNEHLITYRTPSNTELLQSSGDWNQVVSLQSPQNTGRLSRHNVALPGLYETQRKKAISGLYGVNSAGPSDWTEGVRQMSLNSVVAKMVICP